MFYRRFRASTQHIVAMPDGIRFRLGSGLFRDSNGLSVEDSNLCSIDECAQREADTGVVCIEESTLTALKLAVEPDGFFDNTAHCVIEYPTPSQAKALARSAVILIAPAGYEVDDDGHHLRKVPEPPLPF